MIKKIRILVLFTLLFIVWMCIPHTSNAADGRLTASVSTTSSKVTVTIKSSKSLGAYTVTVSGATPIFTESNAGEAGENMINGSSNKGVTTLGKFVFSRPKKDTTVTFRATGCEDKNLNS